MLFFFFKHTTAYEMRISDWSSDVCSSDLEDGLSVSFGWSLSSWESKDGRRYRFFVRRFDGSGQAETVRGEAELDADGSGTAVFHGPERREVALPAGTQFPTHHTRQVLNQAAADGALLWTQVFDGSGGQGP